MNPAPARIVLLILAGSFGAVPAPPAAPGPVIVRMTRDHRFDPQVITLSAGNEVVWKNEDDSVHSVVADPLRALHRSDIEPPAPPEPFHSEDVEPGQTFRRVFSMDGVYRYVCLHNEEQGMNGTVIVTPSEH